MPGTKLRALRRALSARLPTWGQKVAVIGFVGVLLNLVVVHAAVTGVRRLDASYEGLTRIASAQRFFQDADMMHDALRADVFEATQQLPRRTRPGTPQEEIVRDAAQYRGDLAEVDKIMLPADLERQIADLRPIQETYINNAASLGTVASRSPAAAKDGSVPFLTRFDVLEARQEQITTDLTAAVERAKIEADGR